ncbi:MAG: hypothetical protein E6I45_04740 [Chloroflexi bacterium]|nr:MAG: hypothetical protein E6I45_04740 [Chloroflexota bacterium]
MNTWDAIRTKRMIRRFVDQSLAPGELERILDAGRHAGSSKNLQRWDFIVCRDRAHLRELATIGPYAGHLAGAAVAVALVTPDPSVADAPLSVMFDLGQAAGNMMLARPARLPGRSPLRVPAVLRLPRGPLRAQCAPEA